MFIWQCFTKLVPTTLSWQAHFKPAWRADWQPSQRDNLYRWHTVHRWHSGELMVIRAGYTLTWSSTLSDMTMVVEAVISNRSLATVTRMLTTGGLSKIQIQIKSSWAIPRCPLNMATLSRLCTALQAELLTVITWLLHSLPAARKSLVSSIIMCLWKLKIIGE